MAAQIADTQDNKQSQTFEHIPAFYEATLSSIPGPMVQILEHYSGVPQAQQIDHVMQVRDRVYASKPYPCLGMFRFLQLELSAHPLYDEYILPHLKQQGAGHAPIFLDLGTCLGQDLRKLVVDGVSASQLYGTDVELDYIEAGYQLFKDRNMFPADHFICPADVLDNSAEAKTEMNQLNDRVDILHLTGVFHLFSQDQQATIAERCLQLLKKDPGNRLVLGAQVGNVDASDFVRSSGSKRFRHNESSWRQLWESVCASDQWKDRVKRLDVQVKLHEPQESSAGKVPAPNKNNKSTSGAEEGFQWMVWSVWVEFHSAA